MDLDPEQKWYLGAIVCGVLAVLTSPTIIGALIFGLMGIGAVIKGYEIEHGDRPWWAKSWLQLWRERDADSSD